MNSVSKESPDAPMANAAPTEPFGGNPAGEEIAAAVRKYYQAFASDKFEDAVALMLPGMTVYPPYGTLLQLPSQQAALQLYDHIHGLGFHQADSPVQINGVVFGDTAFATYLLQGSETVPGGQPHNVERRGTQVWVKVDGHWIIAHMHISTSDEQENWRGKFFPQ
jgi:ketosteroid isomerase-like protein